MNEKLDGYKDKIAGIGDVAAMGAGAFASKHGKEELLGKMAGKDSLAMRAAKAVDADGGIADRAAAVSALGGGTGSGMAMAVSGGLSKIGLGGVADAVTPDDSKAGEVQTLMDHDAKWGDKFEAALGVSDNAKFGKDELNGLQDAVGSLSGGEGLGELVPDGLVDKISDLAGSQGKGLGASLGKALDFGD